LDFKANNRYNLDKRNIKNINANESGGQNE